MTSQQFSYSEMEGQAPRKYLGQDPRAIWKDDPEVWHLYLGFLSHYPPKLSP